MRLYFDTRLPVLSQSTGWVEAALPDGRNAWLPVKDVEINQHGAAGVPFEVNKLLVTARTLASAPYLWGGTTPDSPDCSGFVYRLFHVYGKILARDANDQVLQGQSATFDTKQAGDLIFYTDVSGGPVTHVGLYMGGAQIMDANPFLGLTIHPVSDMQKWYVFYGVRRIP
jgi:cell wall-associated NlpC family hydrolase